MPKDIRTFKQSLDKARDRKYKRKMSNKRKLILVLLSTLLLICGLYVQNFIVMMLAPVKLYSSLNPIKILMGCLIKRTPIFLLILLMSILLGYLLSGMLAESISSRNGDIKVSKKKTQGENERMGDKEKNEAFELRDYYDPSGIILAKDKDTEEVITIPWKYDNPDDAPPNGNMLIVGDSGSRKTSGVLLPNIFSCMEHGCTIVSTDPKGEIYGETVAAAIAKGYKVKILNLVGNHFQYSDGYDVLKPVRESSSPEEVVNIIVHQIVSNIGSAEENFWNDMNTNLLRLVLLAVAIGEGYVPMTSTDNAAKGRTFRECIELISSDKIDDIIASLLVTDHNRKYLKDKYITWKTHSQKDSIRAGLASKLGVLKTDNLLRILSEDEIDFKRLNDEKSILYIIASDKDDTYKPVLSLVTAMLFREVMEYADEKSGKKLERPFYAFFEEFKNVGYVPDLAIKIAVTRSRNINMVFCFQNIGQMMDQYGSRKGGEHEWLTIASSCATQLCCGANDDLTSKYFSDRTGDVSVIEEAQTQNVSSIAPEPLRFNLREQNRKTTGSRKAYLPSEINIMPKDKILITPAKHNSTMEYKYYYKHHPLYQYHAVDSQNNIILPNPDDHIPDWKKRDMKRDAKETTGMDIDVRENEIKIKKFENLHKRDEVAKKKSSAKIISDTISNFKQTLYEEDNLQEEVKRQNRGSRISAENFVTAPDEIPEEISIVEPLQVVSSSPEQPQEFSEKSKTTIEQPAARSQDYQDYYDDLF